MLHWSLFQSLASLRLLFLLLLVDPWICVNGLLSIESWTVGVLKSLGDDLSTDMFFVNLKFWLVHPRFDLSDILMQLSNPLFDWGGVRLRWLILKAWALKVDFCCVWNVLTWINAEIIVFWIWIYLNLDHLFLNFFALFLELAQKHFFIWGFKVVGFP